VKTILSLLVASCCLTSMTGGAEPLVVNGDFQAGLDGWQRFWSRDSQGQAVLDNQIARSGPQCVKIEYAGQQDWSFQQSAALDVRPGQIYQLDGWLRLEGSGTATLCVSLTDAQRTVTDWSYGAQSTGSTDSWKLLRGRFLIPPGVQQMTVRLIGRGPATVWLDDVSLRCTEELQQLRAADMPSRVRLQNHCLELQLDTEKAALEVIDRRGQHRWKQMPAEHLVMLSVQPDADTVGFTWLDTRELRQGSGRIQLIGDSPEIRLELSAEGSMAGSLSYPPGWVTEPGMDLILSVNAGISYPVDDDSLPEMNYYLYGGHGLCMAWYGITDGQAGVMTLVDTPDDAAVRVPRRDGLLTLAPQWVPQKGQFGPSRRLRFVFFDQGNYVAMCHHYREHREQMGLVKTLDEKRRDNPAVDLLVGAVNVWCWDRDSVEICRQMHEAGIDRILWSNRAAPESLAKLNEMGVLTSRYDIYQDAMNPENFPKLRGLHPDWTSSAWPHDLALGPDGDWLRGWQVRGKDDQWYPCGVLCDRQAIDYARQRIPPELETHPYRCRFIDTTTASPWRECYHPDHPMTRSESRHWKMELLRYISEDCGLVTGSETGHEAAVPYVHYFEGMMSLGPYRVPDAGRRMQEILDEVPERVAKFQTGHYYRLPLWELVYHDSVVAQWYWGDYNNKLPKLWDRRDLWNALYGTPPMFMFDRRMWEEQRDRFVRSYQTAATIARQTGYVRMLSHRWLTDDRAVQQTRFANGTTVTVNFGEQPYTLPDGQILPPLTHRIDHAAVDNG
jgi:hypothetical protein